MECPKLIAALVEAQKELTAPPKSSTAEVVSKKTGARFHYTYAPLDIIIAHIRPTLAKYDLGFTQDVRGSQGRVGVRTVLLHVSGELWQGDWLDFVIEDDPQKAGSAISYARRYSLIAALGIMPEDEDDDGAAAQVATKTAAPPQPKAAPAEPDKDAERRQRVREMILEMEGGDIEAAKTVLEITTQFTAKDGTQVPGVKSVDQLKGRRLEVTYGKIKKRHEEFENAADTVSFEEAE